MTTPNLTFEKLRVMGALLAALAEPPKPLWRYVTVPTQERLERLLERTTPAPLRGEGLPSLGFGLELHVKPGQVAEGWAFSDASTFRAYMEGALTELDLMERIKTGHCEPRTQT